MDGDELITSLNQAVAATAGSAQPLSYPPTIFMKCLKKIVSFIRDAEAHKESGQLSDLCWNKLLAHADDLASGLCIEQYEEEYTDQVAPYALPSDTRNYLRTNRSLIPAVAQDLLAALLVSCAPAIYCKARSDDSL